MIKMGNDIWVVETEFKLFGADFGNRMTVIRLSDGGLLLHSPVKISGEILSNVIELGSVSYIVTPNNFHGLFVEEWRAAFPQAKYFTAKGIQENDELSLSMDSLENEPLIQDIAVVKVGGAPKLNEYAFIHKVSKTLILTDIAFNISTDVSIWTKLFFKLNGALDKFGPTRLMQTMISDPQALNVSVEKILTFNIDKIIVSHGDIVQTNAVATLKEAFSRVCSAKHGGWTNRFSPSRCG